MIEFLNICMALMLLVFGVLYRTMSRYRNQSMLPLVLSFTVLAPATFFIYAQIGSPQLLQAFPNVDAPLDTRSERMRNKAAQQLATTVPAESMGPELRVALYEHMLTYHPDDVDMLLLAAESAMLANQGEANEKVMEHIDSALRHDPKNPKALWLAGLAAAQQHRSGDALELWQRLYPMLDGQTQQTQLKALMHQLARGAERVAVKRIPATVDG